MMEKLILVVSLLSSLFYYLNDAHPARSELTNTQNNLNSDGLLPSVRYRYQYQTSITINNENLFEPTGFRAEAIISAEKIWQHTGLSLVLIQLEHLKFQPRTDIIGRARYQESPALSEWPLILAKLEYGSMSVMYGHKQTNNHRIIEPTHLNLVVAFLNAISTSKRTTENNQISYKWMQDGRSLLRSSDHFQTSSSDSLLAPIIFDHWEIRSNLAQDHNVPESVYGWQNVSIKSKLFPQAHSKLVSNFELKLLQEKQSNEWFSKLSKASTISQAVQVFADSTSPLISFSIHFKAEKKPCQPHSCQSSMSNFLNDFKIALSEQKSIASNQITVAYLKLLNFIHLNSENLTKKDVLKVLQHYEKSKSKDGNVMATLLDVIAGSRHGESLLAALDFLNLPRCSGQDDRVWLCERFLTTLSISGVTAANMGRSYLAEHSLSIEKLINVLTPVLLDRSSKKWSDERVKHQYALSVGTLLNALHVYNKNLKIDQTNKNVEFDNDADDEHHHSITSSLYSSHRIKLLKHSSPITILDTDDVQKNGKSREDQPNKIGQISEKILKHFQQELDACKDSECRVVYLHAIGNARIVSQYGVLNVLKRHALNNSTRRESVAAMKALRDAVQFEFENEQKTTKVNKKFVTRLCRLLMRIVYDSSLESTSRLIAAELLANHVDRHGNITIELIQHLDKFPSELATMLWKRAVKNVIDRKHSPQSAKNWHLHSKILTGGSASFRYVMGGTGYANVSYGVILEMLKGTLPKETTFSFDISKNGQKQEMINVGLFARGLQSLAGSDSSDTENNELEEDDSTMAGMTLHVLGNQLRPFLFFQSTTDLMGHVWSGTASEPTPVFRANLLLADYVDVKPLINGFIVEQSLRGVLSMDLNGEVQISIWNRNSHSNVQNRGAVLFQGAQEVFTTDRKTAARKFFSFGANAKLNFITDFDFYTTPYKICIQITQPEFIFRHNTRKYEQIHSDNLHRRIHRRSYKIPAKSYVLNRINSEMCALMMNDSGE